MVLRHGCLLLVRDRGKRRYSLPGGGTLRGEKTDQAAIRELYEETGLIGSNPKYIGKFAGSANFHKLYLVDARGRVSLNKKEIADHKWWDMKESVPVYYHVKAAVRML